MFGSMRMIMIGVMVAGLAGAGAYVFKLKADNAILKANAIKLESAIADQKQLIEKQQKDFEEILEANKKFNKLINALQKDIDDLDNRFAIEKTEAIQRIINGASDKVLRCVEIAGGAPLTEQEINATKKSEINRECPSIANPNYVPYNN